MKTTRTSIFDGLSDKEIAAVTEKIKFEYKTYPRGGVIFVYGSDDGKICNLVEGVAETYRTDENGSVALIERFAPGAVFGYGVGGELGGRDYTVIVAQSKCVAGVADIKKLDLSVLPSRFLKTLIDCQQKRISSLAGRTNVLLGRTMRDKLMCYFKNCAEEAGGNTFDLKVTFTGLADLIFADRSAMMREIKNLRDEGIIKTDRRKITIL